MSDIRFQSEVNADVAKMLSYFPLQLIEMVPNKPVCYAADSEVW